MTREQAKLVLEALVNSKPADYPEAQKRKADAIEIILRYLEEHDE